MSILEMKNITKTFGGVHALTDVHFSVNAGEIHALMGENGAGKSTLMNILTGVIPMDKGSIVFNGEKYLQPTIKQMEKAGIAFVHQEINVINDLRVFENIFLNRELKTRWGYLDQKKMIQETRGLFERLGVEIDPMEMVTELKTSEKQLLEICRALYADAKLLILDEPTTALSNEEIQHLFKILRKMRDDGKALIFISHKMPEIFDLADRYTVFRNGKFVSSGKISETTPQQMTSDMIGEVYAELEVYKPRKLGETILSLKQLSGNGFKNINLEVKKGEIIAFTGLAGCGASELMQTIFGVLPRTGGSIEVNGKEVHGSVCSFMKSGVAMLPSNRKENSVIPDMTILENMYVAEHSLSSNQQIIFNEKEEARYQNYTNLLHIKAGGSGESINSLSGGNQQKVFLARWLNTGADVLLFDNPTQGVDVGAKEEIYQLILQFAEAGKTILINTLEIPEIKKVSDRCVVFYSGEIAKIFSHDEIDEKQVMLYSTNALNAVGGREDDK